MNSKFLLLAALILSCIKYQNATAQYQFVANVINSEEGKKAYFEIQFTPGAGPAAGLVNIQVDFSKTTAGASDYSLPFSPIVLNFAGGAPSKQISYVEILEDNKADGGEFVVLTMTDPAGNVSSCTINISDKEASTDFLRGAVGGNINFAEQKLQVSSVYADISFNPDLSFITKKGKFRDFTISTPVRAFYNNGSGITSRDNENPQRFFTIDTTFTQNGQKKVQYWDDRPYIGYQTEIKNLGINVPIQISVKIPNSMHFSFVMGYNFEFSKITQRQFGFKYVNGTRDSAVVNKLSELPIQISDTVKVRSTSTFFRSNPFRPQLAIPNSEFNYFQVYNGVSVGILYNSSAIDCSIKYSIGKTTTFLERMQKIPSSYRHIMQILLVEKKFGLQLLFDLRLPSIREGHASGLPSYYVSFAKTLNIGALKDVFFK